MAKKIKVGILGYGNIGRGVELSVLQNRDMELVAVFTRRAPESIRTVSKPARVLHIDDIYKYKDIIDVLILCGGSATDLPEQGPKYASLFNCVDSFDTHARIPEYFNSVNESAILSGKTAAISIGWDPGLFSMNRLMLEAILPQGESYTFWGKGVSQGHSDAIRHVKGVKNGVQYTVPVESVIDRIRNGEQPNLTTGEKHLRECFVVAEEGADKTEIEETIKNMPNYFADYNTVVHFISDDELIKNHSRMPHGGCVIRSGDTGENNEKRHIVEFSLKLESNPEFTASVLTAYARAVVKLNREGKTGALTVFDIPLSYLSPKSPEELRKELL